MLPSGLQSKMKALIFIMVIFSYSQAQATNYTFTYFQDLKTLIVHHDGKERNVCIPLDNQPRIVVYRENQEGVTLGLYKTRMDYYCMNPCEGYVVRNYVYSKVDTDHLSQALLACENGKQDYKEDVRFWSFDIPQPKGTNPVGETMYLGNLARNVDDRENKMPILQNWQTVYFFPLY